MDNKHNCIAPGHPQNSPINSLSTQDTSERPRDVTLNTRRPASEHDPRLQLLNIAQELQDMIYAYAFQGQVAISKEAVEACYEGNGLLLALQTNSRQDIFRRAEEIYYSTATFQLDQEHLVPWLKKHKSHSKYIKKIRVNPTEAIKEEDGLPWTAKPCISAPDDIGGLGNAILWVTARTLFDTRCALKLSLVLKQMSKDVEEAGISIRRKVIQVPVYFDIPERRITLWTEHPVKEVVDMWDQRMENLPKDLTKIMDEDGDEDEDEDEEDADGTATDGQEDADNASPGVRQEIDDEP